MNKMKQVALKAKKETESVKKEVKLFYFVIVLENVFSLF